MNDGHVRENGSDVGKSEIGLAEKVCLVGLDGMNLLLDGLIVVLVWGRLGWVFGLLSVGMVLLLSLGVIAWLKVDVWAVNEKDESWGRCLKWIVMVKLMVFVVLKCI